MLPITYKLLTKENVAQYRKVRLACLQHFPDNFGTTLEEESQNPKLKLDDYLLNNDAHSFMFGAFQGQTLIGICGFVNESRHKTKHRGEIVQMYINPAFSGQGIGEKLLRYCIEQAFNNPAIEQIILSAVAENQKAINMYLKAGFRRYGYLENYFKWENNYSAQVFMVLTRADYIKPPQ